MQYGYFDDEKREYVITNPATPKPWVNYLGSPVYGAIISNNSGRKRSTVIFEPLSDMSALSDADTPKMRVVKDTLKDVVYVNTRAIRNGNNGKFVYVVGEDGYLDAVNITVGEEIGEYTVVLSGLNSGEEVLKGK